MPETNPPYRLEVAGESDRLAKPGLNAPALPPSPQPSSAAKGAGWRGRLRLFTMPVATIPTGISPPSARLGQKTENKHDRS